MSADVSCERSRAPIVTSTILSKKASKAKVADDIISVLKTKRCVREEVMSSRNKLSRKEVLDGKKARLRRLFERDVIDLEKSLRELGYAFVLTQP